MREQEMSGQMVDSCGMAGHMTADERERVIRAATAGYAIRLIPSGTTLPVLRRDFVPRVVITPREPYVESA